MKVTVHGNILGEGRYRPQLLARILEGFVTLENTQPPAVDRRQIIRRLMVEARPYYGHLAGGLVLGIVAGLGPLSLSKAFPLVIDGVINNPNHPIKLLVEVMVGVFVINALANAAGYGQSYLTAWAGQRMLANLRIRLFERTLRMPLEEFDKWRPGEFNARFTTDLQLLTDALTTSLPQLFVTLVTFIGAIVYMFVVDWLLTLCLFIFAPVVNFVVATFTRLISKATQRAQERIADLSASLTETIAGERVVKSFGREVYETGRFEARNEAYFGAFMKALQLGQTQTPVVATIIMVALLGIMAFSVREVIVGRMTSGSALQFWTLVVFAINPMNRFASFVGDISKGIVGATRIFEIIDLPIERDAQGAFTPERVAGGLRFENVTFWYKSPDHLVLRSLSAEIAPGDIVALVGPSGSGKTTLVNLVPRFYAPRDGRILLDGVEIGQYALEPLRSAIAIVPQDPMLFSGTVAENIRYGRLEATQSEVESAAREANAEEFVLDLPLGYDTTVGQRGIQLSGGQRQRIAIARAVLRDPRILILDEATSALDSHSERLIELALDRILPGRTTLIIAHRLSTIRRANKILYIDGGRVVEVGTHDELMSRGGRYAQLHAAQFAL